MEVQRYAGMQVCKYGYMASMVRYGEVWKYGDMKVSKILRYEDIVVWIYGSIEVWKYECMDV